MPVNEIQGDLRVVGHLTAKTMKIPDGTVTDAAVNGSANISASKLQQQIAREYAQPNTAAADETRGCHRARGAGTVAEVFAGSIAIAVGDATCTIDLKKNGASILTAVITLNSANTARVAVTAAISTAAYVAGDFFEWVIDGTIGAGTLPTGVFAGVVFREAADAV